MVKIRKQLSSNSNHYGRGNPANYITIHETDNWSYGANAQMHSNYIDNGSSATWHYTVDDIQAIQSYEHHFQLWHAGDGRGKGNTQSIGIEICVNRDGNYLKAVQNTVELVQILMNQENIPLSNVVQHNNWSGKNCPRALRHGRNGISWNKFKQLISNETLSIPTSNLEDLVRRTLEGEFGNGEARKRILGPDYNRVQKEINRRSKAKTSDNVDITQLVERTLEGEFGNGKERERKLGKYYEDVQKQINKMFNIEPSVNINNLVERTLKGEFGNGEERKNRLGKYYDQVQREINKRLQ